MTDIAVRPMNVGAEIMGLKPGSEGDPDVRAALYEAWLAHGILLIRNVETMDQHLALSRCFGELEIHPFPEIRYKENPLFVQIGGEKRGPANVYDGRLLAGRIPWHRDTAYTPDICKGAMLRMLEVPEEGGETLLADTAMAYDDLPQRVKDRIEGLEYKSTLRLSAKAQSRPGKLWKTVRRATKEEDPSGGGLSDDDSFADRYPSVVHPVVLTHPESGRRCIFLSPTYVDHFIGMDQAESDDLLNYLTDHMLHDRYVYTHRWDVNDAILWDNRRFMHAALGYAIDAPRRALRTTLAGAIRTGRFYDESASNELPVIAD